MHARRVRMIPTVRALRAVTWCTVVALSLAAPRGVASAQLAEATRTAAPTVRHVVRWFTTADGLPGNYVSALKQGHNGVLWLIASGVLTRYDGRRFEEVALPAADRTTTVAEVPTALEITGDTLWVATSANRVLQRVGGIWSTAFRTDSTLSEIAGRPGVPLIGTSHIADTTIIWRASTVVAQMFDRRGGTRRTPRLIMDTAGTAWTIGMSRRAMSVRPNGALMPSTTASDFDVFVVAPDAIAPVVARTVGATMQLVSAHGASVRTVAYAPTREPRLLTHDGRVLATSATALEIHHGLERDAPERIPGDFTTGARYPTALLEDHEGTIWMGTSASGLLRLRPSSLRNVSPLGSTLVKSISRARDGSALLMSAAELYRTRAMEAPERVALPGMPPLQSMWSAVEDHTGTLWVSGITASGRGVLAAWPAEFTMRGMRTPVLHWDVLAVQLVADSTTRQLMALQYNALNFFSIDAPERVAQRTVPLGALNAHSMLVGADGVVTIAGQSGVVVLPANRAQSPTRYTVDAGYALAGARALHRDTSGAVWVGLYGGGLARLANDSLRVLRRQDGLGENIVSAIVEDADGTFWMSGNRGVHVLTRSDRDAWVSGARHLVAGARFDEGAGLNNPEGSGWYGMRDTSGAVWLPSFGGAIVVPPNAASVTQGTLPRFGTVSIDGIMSRDSAFSLADSVRLPLGWRDLAVHVVSVSLQAPDARPLEYRAPGITDTWQPVAADGVVRLTSLKPGRWSLQVRGMQGASAPQQELRLAVIVPPYVHETGAFLALCVAGVVAVVVVSVRARTRVLSARAQSLREEVEEQTHWLLQEQDRTARALERAVDTEGKLRELLQSRARSFASLSHELRTPMTLLLQPLRELVTDEAGPLPPAARERVGMLQTAVGRLERLTEQFLDLADTQSGTLRIQKRVLDVGVFVRNTVAPLQPLAARKQVALTVSVPEDMPLTARIDPDHMDKVITNLVTNAIRHVPNGGAVEVVLSREEGDEPQIVLEVRDNGPGISEEVMERIFDPFFQGPNASEGMGLGLALSRDIVVQHGGTIEVFSELGHGATFRVTLPRRVDDVAAAQGGVEALHTPADVDAPKGVVPALASSDPTSALSALNAESRVESPAPLTATERAAGMALLGGQSYRVLVVEDDYDLREMLRARLGERHTVRVAESAEAALSVLHAWVPDVVVSDIMMPGIDGLALCRILKADPATRTIPVVLLTAKGTLEDQERGLMMGADAYIVKPFDVKQLVLRLENLVGLRRSIEARYEANVPVWASMLVRTGARELDREAEQFLSSLYRYLVEQMGDASLNIDAMARYMAMSRSSFYRRVRELLACAPSDLLTEVRLERAALLLRTTEDSVALIGQRVGFGSAPYFSRRFTAHFGMTPGEYRRRMAGR